MKKEKREGLSSDGVGFLQAARREGPFFFAVFPFSKIGQKRKEREGPLSDGVSSRSKF